MHFCGVNVTFYEAINTIHDVITTANSFPYTNNNNNYAAKFMFFGVRNNKTQQIRR